MSDDQPASEERSQIFYAVDVFDIDGAPLNIKFAIDFPTGKGFTAIQVLQQLGEPGKTQPLCDELIRRQDTQCLEMLFRKQIENNL